MELKKAIWQGTCTNYDDSMGLPKSERPVSDPVALQNVLATNNTVLPTLATLHGWLAGWLADLAGWLAWLAWLVCLVCLVFVFVRFCLFAIC